MKGGRRGFAVLSAVVLTKAEALCVGGQSSSQQPVIGLFRSLMLNDYFGSLLMQAFTGFDCGIAWARHRGLRRQIALVIPDRA